MCDLCGDAHNDMRSERGLTVCVSARHCLLRVLREADELRIARLHRSAVDSALRRSEKASRTEVAVA